MCPAWILLSAGKSDRLNAQVTVAAVIAPPASRVRSNVICAAPRALDSAFAIGGTSLLAARLAVNTIWFGFEGAVGLSSSHPATSSATAQTANIRFIGS